MWSALLAFDIVSWIAIGLVVVLALLVLFEPSLRYGIAAVPVPPDSEAFLRVLGALANAQLHRQSSVEVLSGGRAFYGAELEAIGRAAVSVHIEAFIFHPGAIGERFLAALVERARRGVQVKVVVDAVGSFPTPDRFFRPLRDAGGQVRRYQPLGLATLKHLNNRTHRELIVIDGIVGFIGGAGIAPHWDVGDRGGPPWRDLMFQVRGGLVAGLQTTFAENWLESSGEVLADPADFPAAGPDAGTTAGLVVISSPTAGRSTRNRVLFQLLLASARQSVQIHSPYFLPDPSVTAELVRAVRDRGVRVRVIVPSASNNHPFTRLASRRRYGRLLEAGVEIHEYQPGMIHTKTLTVDGLWVVVGSTNFDSRSFELNDEVNLVAVDRDLAARVEAEFAADLVQCRRVTFEQWSRRGLAERLLATAARVLERQE